MNGRRLEIIIGFRIGSEKVVDEGCRFYKVRRLEERVGGLV